MLSKWAKLISVFRAIQLKRVEEEEEEEEEEKWRLDGVWTPGVDHLLGAKCHAEGDLISSELKNSPCPRFPLCPPPSVSDTT